MRNVVSLTKINSRINDPLGAFFKEQNHETKGNIHTAHSCASPHFTLFNSPVIDGVCRHSDHYRNSLCRG